MKIRIDPIVHSESERERETGLLFGRSVIVRVDRVPTPPPPSQLWLLSSSVLRRRNTELYSYYYSGSSSFAQLSFLEVSLTCLELKVIHIWY